jgi:hypothetical protein
MFIIFKKRFIMAHYLSPVETNLLQTMPLRPAEVTNAPTQYFLNLTIRQLNTTGPRPFYEDLACSSYFIMHKGLVKDTLQTVFVEEKLTAPLIFKQNAPATILIDKNSLERMFKAASSTDNLNRQTRSQLLAYANQPLVPLVFKSVEAYTASQNQDQNQDGFEYQQTILPTPNASTSLKLVLKSPKDGDASNDLSYSLHFSEEKRYDQDEGNKFSAKSTKPLVKLTLPSQASQATTDAGFSLRNELNILQILPKSFHQQYLNGITHLTLSASAFNILNGEDLILQHVPDRDKSNKAVFETSDKIFGIDLSLKPST